MLTKSTLDESTREGLMNRTISIACLAVALVGMFALGVMSPSAPVATTTFAHSTGTVFMPAVADWEFLSASATPPTEAQCYSAGRRCFTPHSMANSYNYAVLHALGNQGQGVTIAVIDSYGSDTIRHDLHVFNQAFGLQAMCGEEGVTCTPGMPTFDILRLQGAPATKAPPPNNGTGLEDKSAWALEVALDVQWAHATAPKANILLVTTPTAETLGVQGFPDMMNAEQYVIDHHMANVISQSFASAEDAFGSAQSLLTLRHAYVSAAQQGVTVLGSSGDGGTANAKKSPVKVQPTIPY